MAYDKPYEEKPNTGSFFANKTKTNPKAPDYRGKVLLDLSTYDIVNGTITVELAGWKQVAKSGLTYLQIKAQKPRDDQDKPKPVQTVEIEDDIPF
jgi:hypothetical protein|tara:strand:- start:709 stop:993 length:285 start_codon:yes stop_codon:yes gene_type:complete